ncbi:hypothetical protein JB92DRAFT_2912685 [Gautieria morchelliformis]|nr:hypothetical protein JB92DRAFT_2912685 [Gautieria morchelliformis]
MDRKENGLWGNANTVCNRQKRPVSKHADATKLWMNLDLTMEIMGTSIGDTNGWTSWCKETESWYGVDPKASYNCKNIQ